MLTQLLLGWGAGDLVILGPWIGWKHQAVVRGAVFEQGLPQQVGVDGHIYSPVAMSQKTCYNASIKSIYSAPKVTLFPAKKIKGGFWFLGVNQSGTRRFTLFLSNSVSEHQAPRGVASNSPTLMVASGAANGLTVSCALSDDTILYP